MIFLVALVFLIPDYQGRVMTSTAGGYLRLHVTDVSNHCISDNHLPFCDNMMVNFGVLKDAGMLTVVVPVPVPMYGIMLRRSLTHSLLWNGPCVKRILSSGSLDVKQCIISGKEFPFTDENIR